MFGNLYATPYYVLIICTLIALIIWAAAGFILRKFKYKKPAWIFITWQVFNIVMAVAAILFILYFSVLRREMSSKRQLVFFAFFGREFFRELIMNAALYFPFGLGFSSMLAGILARRGEIVELKGARLGRCIWIPILSAFALTLGIETWQYFAGAGVAQGTDVIMNTAGASVGTLHLLISRIIPQKKAD